MQPALAPAPPAQPARFPLRILDTRGVLHTVDADSSQVCLHPHMHPA